MIEPRLKLKAIFNIIRGRGTAYRIEVHEGHLVGTGNLIIQCSMARTVVQPVTPFKVGQVKL